MMNNYYYIIAGLPVLDLDYESRNFSIDSFLEHIVPQLNKKDKRLIDWILFGLESENLTPHFYRTIKKSKSDFLRKYFCFDLVVRNILSADTAFKTNQDPYEFIYGLGDITGIFSKGRSSISSFAAEYDFGPKLMNILEISNILDREKAIDLLRWDKATGICTYNYFDIDVILSFILKSSFVQRWARLDRKSGEQMFRQLVEEIKGSGKLNKEEQL